MARRLLLVERARRASSGAHPPARPPARAVGAPPRDRKSTRLNSSHGYISYAVFCLKKKIVEHVATYANLTDFACPISQTRYRNSQVFTALITHHDEATIGRYGFKHQRADLFECLIE